MHAAPHPIRLRGDRPPPGSGEAVTHPVDEADVPDTERWLRCRECDHPLAREDAGFSVPGHGPIATFVNPGGFVHEVRTLREAPGALHAGRRVRADSWFPGYTWRYGLCGGCTAFIGWYYEAVGPVAPDRFWGLRAAATHEA